MRIPHKIELHSCRVPISFSTIPKTTLQRICNDLSECQTQDKSVTAHVRDESNLFRCIGTIEGPPDTPYARRRFYLDISLPFNYPYDPPEVFFSTKIFHPNVSFHGGRICLDTLSKGWSPATTLRSLLVSIQSFLNDPNPDDPLNLDAATLYLDNPREYQRQAKQYAERFGEQVVHSAFGDS